MHGTLVDEESVMQTPTRLMPAPEVGESEMGPYFPIRVFLLSDCKLLCEAFARALQNHTEIVLAGAQQFSAATPADIVESACDVLLMDPINISAFDIRILKALRAADFKIVIIDWEARITDVLSLILTVAQSADGFSRETNSIGL
jgi:DNA-binding NarL/FixJ family response regulator